MKEFPPFFSVVLSPTLSLMGMLGPARLGRIELVLGYSRVQWPVWTSIRVVIASDRSIAKYG
jgi:ABC-type methionine transport system permease subunit